MIFYAGKRGSHGEHFTSYMNITSHTLNKDALIIHHGKKETIIFRDFIWSYDVVKN